MIFPNFDKVRTPWMPFMNGIPAHLDYPDGTMVEAMAKIAREYPDLIAYDFMGGHTSYTKAMADIDACARALRAAGVKENDRVTIAMPNAPQAISMFYAVNKVGAIANMIHPLSAEGEIEFYLNDSRSVAALTLDQFYGKFAAIRKNTPALKTLIVASVKDALKPVMKLGYALTAGRKIPKLPKDGDFITWNAFIENGKRFSGDPTVPRRAQDPAVILYSGGTTGVTKGILLSNLNFNALGAQIIATNPMFAPGDKMLTIMPMFHGFGLGVRVH